MQLTDETQGEPIKIRDILLPAESIPDGDGGECRESGHIV